ncbi:MAG: hypothetical protein ACYTG0_44360 [Planctomycetota bacterium]|jgi:hypothetical protein
MGETTQSLPAKIVTEARKMKGQRVGKGSCYEFPERILTAAGAKTPHDYHGPTLPSDGDYQWGTPQGGDSQHGFSALDHVLPGDVIQFIGFYYEWEPVNHAQPELKLPRIWYDYSLHTAVVVERVGDRKVRVLHQNVNVPRMNASVVVEKELDFSGSRQLDRMTATLGKPKVLGRLRVYRPQPE